MSKETGGEELLPATLVSHMAGRPNVDDFLMVVRAIGECLVLYDHTKLARLHDYVLSVRRNHACVPESEIYALARGVSALLESVFATIEPYERMDKLIEEFRFDTMWQGILRVLHNAGKEGLTKAGINNAVKARMPGVVLDMLYLSNILTDFQNRELVEFFPSSDNTQEAACALTMLGRQLFSLLGLDKPKCGSCGRVL